MFHYNPDSYLLYGVAKSPRPCFPIRIRLIMNEAVRGDVLDSAAQRAIKRYPYFAVRVELILPLQPRRKQRNRQLELPLPPR